MENAPQLALNRAATVAVTKEEKSRVAAKRQALKRKLTVKVEGQEGEETKVGWSKPTVGLTGDHKK